MPQPSSMASRPSRSSGSRWSSDSGDAEDAPLLLAGCHRPAQLAVGDHVLRRLVPRRAVERRVLGEVGELLVGPSRCGHGQAPPRCLARAAARMSIVRSSTGRRSTWTWPTPRSRHASSARATASTSGGSASAAPGLVDGPCRVEGETRGDLEGGGVAALGFARGDEVGTALREPLVREAEPGRVPGVRVAGREPEHPLALGGDQDGDPAGQAGGSRRRRDQDGVVDVVPSPVEGHALALRERTDDRERLLEPPGAMVERIAEGGVFGLVPAGPDAEDQAPVGDLVERRGHLRRQRGRPEAGAEDDRPELHPVGHRGDRRQQRPRFVDTVLWLVGHPEDEMVVRPHAVEAAGLRVGRQLTDPRPLPGAISVKFIHGQDHADLHVRHGTGRIRVER